MNNLKKTLNYLEKSSCHCLDSNPGLSSPYPSYYTDYDISDPSVTSQITAKYW
jgi:hypothetical protein